MVVKNTMEKKENEKIYDSVFDFIFGVQETKKNKPFPRIDEGMSDYASALVDIGTQPLLYPLDSAFKAINGAIEKATEADIGGGVTMGVGSGALKNPVGYSKKEVAKNRAKSKWASIGGSLHYSIDGALFSLYAKSGGASSEIAHKSGKLFNDVLKEEIIEGYEFPNHRIFGPDFLLDGEEKGKVNRDSRVRPKRPQMLGYQTSKEIQEVDDRFFERAVDLRATVLSSVNPNISKGILIKNINDLQSVESQNDRVRKTAELLRVGGVEMKEALQISYMLWGDPKRVDLGMYRIKEDVLNKKIGSVASTYKLKKGEVNRIYKSLKTEDKKRKKEDVFKVLRRDVGLDEKTAYNITKEIVGIEVNDGKKIAKESIYYVLATDISANIQSTTQQLYSKKRELLEDRIKSLEHLGSIEGEQIEKIYDFVDRIRVDRKGVSESEEEIFLYLTEKLNLNPEFAASFSKELVGIKEEMQEIRQIEYDQIATVKDKVKSIIEPSSKSTLGMKVERAVLVGNWLAQSGKWGEILVDGTWEKLGVEDINFTKIVEEVKVKKDGVETGQKFYTGANSVMGRLFGHMYYLHPNNLIKGLFIDGSLWLKWASDKAGNVNTKSFAYFMSNLSLGNSLSFLTKPFKGLIENFSNKIINPFFEQAKAFVKGLLTKMIGATGLGGILVNLLMNVVSDKFVEIANQIVILFVFAFLGILFILFDGTGIMYSDEYVDSVTDYKQSEIIESNESSIFLDEDFESAK